MGLPARGALWCGTLPVSNDHEYLSGVNKKHDQLDWSCIPGIPQGAAGEMESEAH